MQFDALAETYDDNFTDTAIGRDLRGRVQRRLLANFRPGQRVLELGCGTGVDALWLATQGVQVLATDSSTAMLAQAAQRTRGQAPVQTALLDLAALPDVPDVAEWQFDGVFANFGPLNCLHTWRPLAAWLARRLKPGAKALFGVMAPYCAWELLWHGVHGEWDVATRRWRRADFQPQPNAAALPIAYPSVKRLTQAFAPDFKRVYLRPLGLWLPPSDVYGVLERRPRALRWLTGLDVAFCRLPALANFADHYWIEFERR